MVALAHLPFSTYRLDKALLVYSRHASGTQTDARRADRAQPPSSFVTMHDVVQSPSGQPTLGVGRPATAEAARTLAAEVLGHKPPGLIPPRVLAVGDESCTWYVPAGKRVMYFQTSNEELRAASGEPIAHPGLVFRVDARGTSALLRVFAFRKRGRPSPSTRLYQAPLLNVGARGAVCLGSTQVPSSTAPSSSGDWTAAFFASAFSHANASVLRTNGPTYAATVAELARTGDPFPGDRLIRLQLSLADVLRS